MATADSEDGMTTIDQTFYDFYLEAVASSAIHANLRNRKGALEKTAAQVSTTAIDCVRARNTITSTDVTASTTVAAAGGLTLFDHAFAWLIRSTLFLDQFERSGGEIPSAALTTLANHAVEMVDRRAAYLGAGGIEDLFSIPAAPGSLVPASVADPDAFFNPRTAALGAPGGDWLLASGSLKALNRVEVLWANTGRAFKQFQTQRSIANGVTTGNTGSDEFGPVWLYEGAIYEARGANHSPVFWRITTAAVDATDIGKVWTNGTNYITLCHYDAGNTYAYFSYQHNAAGDSMLTASAPSGTWTSSGNPSIDFASTTPTSSQLSQWDDNAEEEEPWADGRGPLFRHILTQEIPSKLDIAAYARANPGATFGPGDVDPTLTLKTITEFRGDAPGVVYVTCVLTFNKAATINEWGGPQAVHWGGKVAWVGTTGATYSGGLQAHVASNLFATSGYWLNGAQPEVVLMADDQDGGGAIGLLQTSLDRSNVPYALRTASFAKSYLNVATPLAGQIAAGTVHFIRAFRSYCYGNIGRQFHLVPDFRTGQVKWWAASDSAGNAEHPMCWLLQGRGLTQLGGTMNVTGPITSKGVTMSGAGDAWGVVST